MEDRIVIVFRGETERDVDAEADDDALVQPVCRIRRRDERGVSDITFVGPGEAQQWLGIEFDVDVREDAGGDHFGPDPLDIRKIGGIPEHRRQAATRRNAGERGALPVGALRPDGEGPCMRL